MANPPINLNNTIDYTPALRNDAATGFGFLPVGFEPATAGGGDFLKMPEDGDSIRFVPLGRAISGWLYWTEDKKCHRSATPFAATPGMREDDKVKEFLLFNVYDLDTQEVKLLEVTQVSVQRQIVALATAGDYTFNDGSSGFRVSRIGKALKTTYTTGPTPVKKGAERDGYDAIDLDGLTSLAKFAFEKREASPDVAEALPDVM
jgi:hypothetical protein